MRRARSIRLRNVVFFKDVTLPLDKYPLLVIQGRNHNARGKGQSNAVGKSVLASSIPDMRFDALPVSSKKKDRAFFGPGKEESSIAFAIDDENGVPFTVTKSGNKKIKYRITKNGKTIKIRTNKLAQKYLEKLIPHTQAEFYSTVYLDGRRQPAFQFGTDSERLKFLTDFFRLNNFDAVHRKLLDRRRLVKETSVRADTIEAELVRARREAKEAVWSSADDKALEEKLAEHSDLNARYQSVTKRISKLNALWLLAERQKDLDARLAKCGVPKFKSKLRSKMIQLHDEWDSYEAETVEYTNERKHLMKRIAKLGDHDHADADKKLSKVERLIGSIGSQIESIEDVVSEVETQLEKLRGDYREVQDDVKGLERPVEKRQTLEEKRADLQHTMKLVKLIEKGHTTCPTCDNAIDAKAVRKRAMKSSTLIKDIDRRLTALEAYERLDRLVEHGKQIRSKQDGADKAKLADLRKQFKQLRDKRSGLRRLMAGAEALREAKADLKAQVRPKRPASARPDETIQALKDDERVAQRYDDLTQQRKALEAEVEDVTETTRIDLAKLPKSKTLMAEQNDLNKRLQRLVKSGGELRARKLAATTASDSLNRLLKLKAKFDDKLKDGPILDALLDEYSNKGLKVRAAQQIAVSLERNLNESSHKVFVEPTTFKIQVSSGKFSVAFTRGDRTADIARLSGAESRCFSLLFFAALLPLVPSDRRLNFAVLDEMDANMSEPTRQIFVNDFLPHLRTLVPNIIVLTPDTSLGYPGKIAVVEKRGNVSTLKLT